MIVGKGPGLQYVHAKVDRICSKGDYYQSFQMKPKIQDG